MLPWPRTLRLFPTPLALHQAIAAHATADDTLCCTFAQLWQYLGNRAPGRLLSPLAARLWVRTCLAESVGPYRSCAHDAWGVRAVQRALDTLRLAGITAAHFAHQQISAPLAALVALLRLYEEGLQTQGRHDHADVQRQAVLDVALGRLPRRLQDIEAIDVLCGHELLGARLDLLSAFAARGVAVTVRIPYDSSRSEAFGWPEALLAALEARAHPQIQVRFDDRVGSGPLAAVRAAQWTSQVVQAPVSVRQVTAGCEHAHHVVLQIGQWLAAGVPAQRMAVVTADDDLAHALVHAFAGAGVPLQYGRGHSLWESADMQRWATAWHLPERGFPREDMLDLWHATGRTIPTPMGPWYRDRVAFELRRAGWRSARLGTLRAALQRTTPACAGAVADALEHFCDALQQVPASASTAQWLQVLDAWLPTLGHFHDQAAEQGLRRLLCEFADSHDARPWSKGEWGDWLRMCSSDVTLAPAAACPGGVRLLAPDDIVGARLERVLFAGANVGVFPRPHKADTVLTESLRAEVNRIVGPRLLQFAPVSGRDALPAAARDTWLWQEVLAACQQELVVTVGRAPGEDVQAQSEVVEELLRSTGQLMTVAAPSYHQGGAWPQAWLLRAPAAQGLLAGSTLSTASTQCFSNAAAAPAMPRSVMAGLLHLRARCAVAHGVLPPAAQAALQTHFFDTVHSTSRLDALGMCAYRYFAQAVLRLTLEDVPPLGATAREQGSIAHAALHVVYRDMQGQGGIRQARLQPDKAIARAAEVFWREADTILAEVAVHPSLRQAALGQAWTVVQAQLQRDMAASSAAEPTALEYRFDDRDGVQPHAPELQLSDPTGHRALRIRGSIDRVDWDGATLWVLDYKRSVKKRSDDRHFQLAIYGAVASRDLATPQQVRAGWVALSDGRRTLTDSVAGTPEAMLERLQQALWGRIERLLAGDISPDPDGPQLCERCDFRALCRHDARLLAAMEGA